MKIMTWNIWGGRHIDGVMSLIEEENPDVIGLQEVKEIAGENMAETIAAKFGYHVAYCRSFTTDRHTPVYTLGNAILSKSPSKNKTCHILSTIDEYLGSAATEPRTAVEIESEHSGKPLRILTTHLGYSDKFGESAFRDEQIKKLLPLITKSPCILMGDFNSIPGSKTVTEIEKYLVNADNEKTAFSYTDMKDPDKTTYRIDYIFADKSISLKDFKMHDTHATGHRPRTVEL